MLWGSVQLVLGVSATITDSEAQSTLIWSVATVFSNIFQLYFLTQVAVEALSSTWFWSRGKANDSVFQGKMELAKQIAKITGDTDSAFVLDQLERRLQRRMDDVEDAAYIAPLMREAPTE